MSNKLTNTEDKVKFIIALFEYYQPKLTLEEQKLLLQKWLKSCILEEEYEMAKAIKDKTDYIILNLNSVPQRFEGGIDMEFISQGPLNFKNELFNDMPMVEEEITPPKKEKLSIYKRMIIWFKKVFNGTINKRI